MESLLPSYPIHSRLLTVFCADFLAPSILSDILTHLSLQVQLWCCVKLCGTKLISECLWKLLENEKHGLTPVHGMLLLTLREAQGPWSCWTPRTEQVLEAPEQSQKEDLEYPEPFSGFPVWSILVFAVELFAVLFILLFLWKAHFFWNQCLSHPMVSKLSNF